MFNWFVVTKTYTSTLSKEELLARVQETLNVRATEDRDYLFGVGWLKGNKFVFNRYVYIYNSNSLNNALAARYITDETSVEGEVVSENPTKLILKIVPDTISLATFSFLCISFAIIICFIPANSLVPKILVLLALLLVFRISWYFRFILPVYGAKKWAVSRFKLTEVEKG